MAALQAEYGIEPGQTTPDGELSLATARCLGSCGLAPVLVVDGEVLGRETPEQMVEKIRHLITMERNGNGQPAPAPQEISEEDLVPAGG